MLHGIEHREESNHYHCHEDTEDIAVVHADWIGIDDERALAVTQFHKAELLLQQTEQKTQTDAEHSTYDAYQPSFKDEHLLDKRLTRSKTAQYLRIVLLVDDEHRKGAYDIEACHDEDEGEKDVRHQFLYLHDAERVCLLLVAVEHLELVARHLLHLTLYGLYVAAGL